MAGLADFSQCYGFPAKVKNLVWVSGLLFHLYVLLIVKVKHRTCLTLLGAEIFNLSITFIRYVSNEQLLM